MDLEKKAAVPPQQQHALRRRVFCSLTLLAAALATLAAFHYFHHRHGSGSGSIQPWQGAGNHPGHHFRPHSESAIEVNGYDGGHHATQQSRNSFHAARTFPQLVGYCDHIPPISEEERVQRRSNAAKELREAGFIAFVAEPGASFKYFTNVPWKVSERPFLVVIAANGTHFYISPKFEEGKARELVGNNTAILTWQEDESPYDLVYQALGSPQSRATVTTDPEIRSFIQNGLADSFGSSNKVISGLNIVRNTRGVKSKTEVDILRCANELTKKAIASVAVKLYEGITEDETAGLMSAALRAGGLINVWQLVLFAENAAFPHGTTNKIPLKPGHLVLIDTGGELHGYQSDITRTIPFGEYVGWQSDIWAVVRKAQQAALEVIQPGVPMGEIDKAARNVVAAAGYGFAYETFTHRLGHGIGLQGHEEIYAVKGNEYPIAPGYCFSVEPGIYVVGQGGVRIEDIVCVTEQAPYYELFGPTSDSIDDPLKDH